MKTRRKQTTLEWLIPLILLIITTVIIRIADLDVALQTRFYGANGWAIGGHFPWKFLRDYGVNPAFGIAYGSLAVFAASFFVSRLKRFRWMTLYFVIVMIMGPWVIVNEVFKEHWGRPRPKDLYAFHGDRDFVEAWDKPVPGAGSSFPSGHAAMAFYLFIPYFALRYRSRRWALAFLALGIGYGILMGIARMSQGAHFLSDIVWAAGFVYFTGLAFTFLLRDPVDLN